MTTATTDEFPELKLGKTPARPGAVSLKLSDYLTDDVPAHPVTFGHYQLVDDFPMFGNDQYGDCVWAGAGHETQIFTAEGHGSAVFTDAEILKAYSDVTGFNPDDPDTDQGTDMEQAAAYRRKTGLVDTSGKRHIIGAYTDLGVGNDSEVETAAWLFGGVGVGWELPQSAMNQFNEGKPWTVSRSHTKILGGHYVPIVGADADWLYGISWGKVIPIDRKFLKKYMDEGIAYVSVEILWGGKSLEGFTNTQLLGDLRGIDGPGARTPTPTKVAGAGKGTNLPANPKLPRTMR